MAPRLIGGPHHRATSAAQRHALVRHTKVVAVNLPGVLVGEQRRRPSGWSQLPSVPGAGDADPAEAGIAWTVVGVRPPVGLPVNVRGAR